MNLKGGMDEMEFEKYVMTNIVDLYPDLSNTPRKRVMIKCNSGPGRLNVNLLADLKFLGD